jgi:hypothetical protein
MINNRRKDFLENIMAFSANCQGEKSPTYVVNRPGWYFGL